MNSSYTGKQKLVVPGAENALSQMKYEIANELGYFDRVVKDGWGALTAQESGKIGGIMAAKKAATKKN